MRRVFARRRFPTPECILVGDYHCRIDHSKLGRSGIYMTIQILNS